MFSYFESSVDGIIPNEYSTLEDICSDIFGCIASARDSCMLTARRFWLVNQQLVSQDFPKKIFLFSFNKDASSAANDAAKVNSAQNHQDSNESTSYSKANNATAATKHQFNETLQSHASNNLNSSNVKSQQTKKHD